ncbi:myosin heavy chain, striated muscle-like protein [Tanacetum coccineum]|uniref:Myosin heavy chain, striated muscle-like protein n=1 Tax=Tanacetum coccineum TaxID=301880 RepID=A0ABQ5DED5_9ASTR
MFIKWPSTLPADIYHTSRIGRSKASSDRVREKAKIQRGTAAAAMAARDAAETSLRLADTRATRLRERVEELTKQLQGLDT